MKKILNSIILCIRFPFLYPRNRFTGKHYNNWKIQKQMTDITSKYLKFWLREKPDKKLYYVRLFSEYGGHGWTTWWSPIAMVSLRIFHNILELFHCIPTYTELDALKSEAPGWYKNFGIQICKDIRTQLIKDTIKYIKSKKGLFNKFKALFRNPFTEFRITQWKEKWGTMRLYINGGSDELYKVLDKYETLSEFICYQCGEPATIITSPYAYMLPYCDKCYEQSTQTPIYKKKNSNGEWEELELL